MTHPITPYALEAWSTGWAQHGPAEITDEHRLACATALDMAAEHEDHPDVLAMVAEIAAYEGLLATLEARRKKLSKRWERKVMVIVALLAKGFDASAFVATAHTHLASAGLGAGPPTEHPDDMGGAPAPALGPLHQKRSAVVKVAALAALRTYLRSEPDIEAEWTELVKLAGNEAVAEGLVQGTALVGEKTGTWPPIDVPGSEPIVVTPFPEPDLDKLYADTLDNLRNLDTFSQAPAWITDQLQGLAGDMGRAIATGIDQNVGPDALLSMVNDVIDKGAGAQLYLDESIHYAMQQAALSQLTAAGIGLVDYIAMPGACGICEPLDSSVAGPYTPDSVPSPPMHIRCRCSIAPAGTVSG